MTLKLKLVPRPVITARVTPRLSTAGSPMYVSDVPPPLPEQGVQWYESDTGNTYLYYIEPGETAGQWVQINGGGIGSSTSSNSIESRAELELTVVPSPVTFMQTAGYYEPGDGGDALYKKVDAEPSHSGKVQSLDGAWWELAVSSKFNILQFGGKRDGTTENDVALTAMLSMISAAETGGTVYFPAGRYAFGSVVTYTFPVGKKTLCIEGDGQDATVLYWTGGSGGLLINYSTDVSGGGAIAVTSEFQMRNLTFTTEGDSGGTALTLSNSYGFITQTPTIIENVTFKGDNLPNTPFRYWTRAIHLYNVSYNFLRAVTVIGGSGDGLGEGVLIEGSSSPVNYAIGLTLTDCTFNFLSVAVTYGDYVQGVSINSGSANLVSRGVLVSAGAAGVLAQLSICNWQVTTTNDAGKGIYLQEYVTGVLITNSMVIAGTGSNCVGYHFDKYDGVVITGGMVSSQSKTGSYGIIFDVGRGTPGTGSKSIVADVIVNGFDQGVLLQPDSQDISVQNVNFYDNNTNLTNSSTTSSNRVISCPGYNPVGGVAPITVGASTFNVQAGASPETHYLRQSATNTASIYKDGQLVQLLANSGTYYPIMLGPYESYDVVWATTAPTYTKIIH